MGGVVTRGRARGVHGKSFARTASRGPSARPPQTQTTPGALHKSWSPARQGTPECRGVAAPSFVRAHGHPSTYRGGASIVLRNSERGPTCNQPRAAATAAESNGARREPPLRAGPPAGERDGLYCACTRARAGPQPLKHTLRRGGPCTQ